MDSIDTGDQVFNRRRHLVFNQPEGIEDTEGHVRLSGLSATPEDTEDTEDTEGHVVRTYPGVATDDELDCRMPLPGDEEDRIRRI